MMVAACRDHASCRLVMGSLNSFPNEVKLSCSNHVLGFWDVMQKKSDLGLSVFSLPSLVSCLWREYTGCFDAKRLQVY